MGVASPPGAAAPGLPSQARPASVASAACPPTHASVRASEAQLARASMPVVSIVERPREADPALARALTASSDPNRSATETQSFAGSGGLPCKIAGMDATCFKGREGPLFVTDLIGAAACPERLFVGSSISDTPELGFRWLVDARFASITGAHLLVRGGEWLQFVILPGKKAPSASSDCQVTWSGFRPAVVPGGGDAAATNSWDAVESH